MYIDNTEIFIEVASEDELHKLQVDLNIIVIWANNSIYALTEIKVRL